ncbi:MAG TPA: heme exporter protein CcmB [Rhodopila sp.]|uniref:heme exporter protein CcmB n=1 Tax=Rhodopila sp. TaxID=2480087 RepID=UPI002CACB236|nr:heme exporter protein CcmB [Rhodopila sp.]HVY17011.1 heme exporter protein CcmB [Rhodopila sp.]
MHIFWAVVARDLRLSVRHGGDTVATFLFFLVAASLFPFGIGPEPETLGRIAPGVVWVCALLASLLPLDRLFGADFDDGSLDHLMLSGLPAAGIVAAKTLVHWISTGLPMLLMAGPVAIMLRMPEEAIPTLLLALLPGSLLLSSFGAMCAAVVLGARRAGVLLPILVLPLVVPVLIFGAGAADAAANGVSPQSHILLLTAMCLAALPLCPLAGGAGLRNAVG